jgi:hypothetical protein
VVNVVFGRGRSVAPLSIVVEDGKYGIGDAEAMVTFVMFGKYVVG